MPAHTLSLTDDQLYRALVARDIAFDGLFVVGVRTTGIFCRCTCPARKPLRANVEFFADARAAMFAGYRACKRCRPLELASDLTKGTPPLLGARLKALVDAQPTRRVRDRDLIELGLEPSTARRQFQRLYGMTFQRYSRARRMGQALKLIREGKPMSTAASNTGFASPSGYRDAFAKVFGVSDGAVRTGSPARVLFARWIDTPIGAMLALADDAGLRLLDFVDRRGIERQIGTIRRVLGCAVVPGEHTHLLAIERELHDYFVGRGRLVAEALDVSGVARTRSVRAAQMLTNPDSPGASPIGTSTDVSRDAPSDDAGHSIAGIPVAPIGSGGTLGGAPFQRAVWAELRRIPMGQTRSYAQQASAIGNPKAVRAVARANGENFLAILIPCHRVIGADGSMTGYGGGVHRKQWLLAHEAKIVGNIQPALFAVKPDASRVAAAT